MILKSVACVLFVLPALATTRYVAQSAGTFTGGTACNGQTAITPATFNGLTLSAGDITYICGTLTASAGANGLLSISQSGTSGNPISIIFDTGAIITSPYWGAHGAIVASSQGYIVIDGGTNGVIQATANGTGLTYQNDGAEIYFQSVSNSEVKNLTLSNLYVHTADPTDEGGQATYAVEWLFGSNVTIDHNTCHDARTCMFYAFAPSATSSGISMHDNTVYNINWGLIIGDDGAGGILNGPVTVYGNVIHDFVLWDDNANNNHHDGVYCFVNTSTLNACWVYNNYIYGDPGTHMNTFIFDSQRTGGPSCSGVQIFNNVLVNSSAVHFPANTFIQDWCTNSLVVNNTGVGLTNTGGGGLSESVGIGGTMKNNLISSVQLGIYTPATSTLAGSDYNLFYNLGATNSMVYTGTFYNGVAAWVTGTGFDTHSVTSNPNLTGSYTLNAGSPAIAAGTNLTSLGITALNSDKAGIPRPASGAWDIGAYQYVAPGGSSLGGSITAGGNLSLP